MCDSAEIKIHPVPAIKPKAYFDRFKKTIFDMIVLIRWTKRWGYIIVDNMARAHMLDYDIDLPIITNKEVTGNLDIGETSSGDLVFIVPSNPNYRKIIVVSELVIMTTIKNKQTLVSNKRCTIDAIIEKQKQFTKQNCSIEGQLNISFDFAYSPITLSEYMIGSTNKIDNVRSHCIVPKKDHWEIVCGHVAGLCSVWKIPYIDGDLDNKIIHIIDRDDPTHQVQAIKTSKYSLKETNEEKVDHQIIYKEIH